jgi:glycosyltransferase involved in cell wall biosynthesis
MNYPFFSIIVPTYNRESFIGEAIHSVLQQTFHDFEIIVIDDGSTDNTSGVIKGIQDDRVSYFRKENGERGAARNFGANQSHGGYINFFDSDDLMYPHHLATAHQRIQEWENPEWFHLGYDIKNHSGERLASQDNFTNELQEQILFDNVLSCNGVFLRKDIARKFPFEENRLLASSEDWELWIRLACRFRLLFSNEITSTVVTHDLRSLSTIVAEKVVQRDLLMISLLEKDEVVKAHFGKTFSRFKADRYTFFMLRFAEEKRRKKVWFWALEALRSSFSVIFTKRYLASMKNSILK